MKELNNIDYNNSITNFTSSIQRHYGLKPNYKTLDEVDKLLDEKDYENIIIFLCDGMGNNVIEKNTTENNNLRKYQNIKIRSTYPATTANCTTSFITGLNPITTGWLGWATYFKDLDICVDNFPNVDSVTKLPLDEKELAYKKLPIKHLGKDIEKATNGEVKYYQLMPFGENKYHSLKDLEHRIIKLCNEKGKKYIYAYFENPDKTMHEYGINNDLVKAILNKISKTLAKIERKTTNTILFTTADHGHIDVTPIALYTYYDIMDCLSAKLFSCDARTPMFFVKEERKEEFASLFNKYFSDYYYLLTKKEALDYKIFGEGEVNKELDNIMGDFVGIAKSNYYFLMNTNSHVFKGHHAGMSSDETSIPLIVVKN